MFASVWGARVCVSASQARRWLGHLHLLREPLTDLKKSSSRECLGRAWAEAGTGAASQESPDPRWLLQGPRFIAGIIEILEVLANVFETLKSLPASSWVTGLLPASLSLSSSSSTSSRPMYLSKKYTSPASSNRSSLAGSHCDPCDRQTGTATYTATAKVRSWKNYIYSKSCALTLQKKISF